MRKFIISLAALAGVALVGCNKNVNLPEPLGPEGASITLNIRGNTTKATEVGVADENAMNKIEVLIFNADGNLDAYADISGYDETEGQEATRTVSATTGVKEVFVVTNAPSAWTLSSVGTKAALQAKVADIADNGRPLGSAEPGYPGTARDNFVMIGRIDKSLKAGNNSATVVVSRAAARIRIKKITADFDNPALAAQTFTVKKIYIANAVGQQTMDYDFGVPSYGTPLDDNGNVWYNKYNGNSAAPAIVFDEVGDGTGASVARAPFLLKDFGAGYAIADNATKMADGAAPANNETDAAHWLSFYVMQNSNLFDAEDVASPTHPAPYGGDFESGFTARYTKLVIEATLGSETYFYSIPILSRASYPQGTPTAGILPNYSYDIDELVITRPGTHNPDVPVFSADVLFTISVNPWEVVPIATEAGKYVI